MATAAVEAFVFDLDGTLLDWDAFFDSSHLRHIKGHPSYWASTITPKAPKNH